MTEDNDFDRRSVLKGIAAGSAAIGAVGTASATVDPDAAVANHDNFEAAYDSAPVIEQALNSVAANTVEELISQGLLEESDLTSLEPTGHEVRARSKGTEGVRVEQYEDNGEIVPRISAVIQKDGYAVQLFAYPESDTGSHAIVEDDDGVSVVDPELDTLESCAQVGVKCGYWCILGYSREGWEQLYCYTDMICKEGDYLGCVNDIECDQGYCS